MKEKLIFTSVVLAIVSIVIFAMMKGYAVVSSAAVAVAIGWVVALFDKNKSILWFAQISFYSFGVIAGTVGVINYWLAPVFALFIGFIVSNKPASLKEKAIVE